MVLLAPVLRNTAAGFTASNPTMLIGQIGFETDTLKWKMGDGSTAWTGLSYVLGSVGAHIHAAIDVTVTPAGGITSTNVQAALEELDTLVDGGVVT